jgi:hypothetical protein
MDTLQHAERFALTQKITLMVNRYEVHAVDAGGEPRGLLAVAQQKRMAFKEEVTFYSDESRSTGVALARRAWEVLPVVNNLPSPFLFHFDFVDQGGQVVMSSVRRRSLRDRYDVTVPGARLDGRVAAAMAVALDALQSR